ncbi:MAG: hypothetical protein ABI845_08430 [Polaromonas sp.]
MNPSLQVNLLTERENTKRIERLERIAQKVGVHVEDDSYIDLLKQAAQTQMLIAQIDKAQRESPLQAPSRTEKG